MVAAIAIAGCAGAQAPISAGGSTLANPSSHIRALDASTEVNIQNAWTGSIAGTAPSSLCWSIVPSLPIVGAGDTAGPVSITYKASTTCPIPAGIDISYGPAAFTGPTCTFNVVYDVNFSFSITQGTNTACSIKYPPLGINAIFVYAQDASGSGHVVRPVRMH
jgi:hypothetical protein